MVTYKIYRGSEVEATAEVAEEIAQLRVSIFSDYPYLYKGSVEEDMEYTSTLAQSATSFTILAYDEGRVVGALTANDIDECGDEIRRPFRQNPERQEGCCYIGETLLVPQYQGRGGIGIKLYKMGEQIIREMGYRTVVVCTVDRAKDDPRRPATYHDVNITLAKLGFEVIPEIKAEVSWEQVDSCGELVENRMSFLAKTIRVIE